MIFSQKQTSHGPDLCAHKAVGCIFGVYLFVKLKVLKEKKVNTLFVK